jgi:heptosyltransferase-3
MKPFRPSRPPRRILVVCLRRLGDVLLATTLIRSVRRAWPEARLEVLVSAASAAVLEGNPDIDELIVEPASRRGWRTAWRVLRRYDLAVNTLYNDRPFLYTLLASSTRVSVVPPPNEPGWALKRRVVAGWCLLDLDHIHAVEQYLRLADALGIPRYSDVVPPRPRDTGGLDAALGFDWRREAYAVVHPSPLYRYKAWTLPGWAALVEHLVARGLRVVLTGGRGEAEVALVQQLIALLPPPLRASVVSVAGRLRLAELTPLIEQSRGYVGPDTSVTHLAAATGRPTVALFGPSHPIAWGPWPQGFRAAASTPWLMKAPLQQIGNVWLVQGTGDCVPCLQEGCDRHLDSRAACLDELDPQRVIDVVDAAFDRMA